MKVLVPALFLKYHPLSYLESFQQGILYCNPIQRFAELDPVDGRGDPLEYLTKIEKGPNTKVDLGYGDTHIKIIRQQDGSYVSEHSNNDLFANLFCLYSIKKNHQKPSQDVFLPERLRAMGTHVLLINRPDEFINRVIMAMSLLNKKYAMAYVEYLDLHDNHGRKSYFQKPLEYDYQQEFRIMIGHDKEAVQQINIGNIADISVILPSEQLKQIKLVIK